MNLRDSVVVITGASAGIGRAAALEFTRAGADLVLAGRRVDELTATAEACAKSGRRAEIVATDVSKREQCDALIAASLERFGRVDVLVNNAGFAIFDPIADARVDDLERMMQTNYFGAVYCSRAVLPHMLARRSGAIVNVSSISGIMGFAGMGGYCASKFALQGFTEALRNEVMQHGIRVSAVCPSTTRTDFFITAEKGKMPAASRLMLAIRPETVARTIVRSAQTGRARTIVPFTAATYMKFKEMMPGVAHAMMRKVSSLLQRKKH